MRLDNRVYLTKCDEYDAGLIEGKIDDIFETLCPKDFITKEMKVAVKPNLLMEKRPEDAVTTNPVFIEALCRAVIKRGAKAVICDSPSGPFSPALLASLYRVSGMERAAQNSGATLNYDVSYKDIPCLTDSGKTVFPVISAVCEADLVISAAKLKTHTLAFYSGAVKNLFGVIPGLKKPGYHFKYRGRNKFFSMIVDLCETVKPGISFIDGITAMEGNGPSAGSPRQMNAIISSMNPHACDLVGAHIMNYGPMEIPTLKEAIVRGICSESVDTAKIIGGDIDRFYQKDFAHPHEGSSSMFMKYIPDRIRTDMVYRFTRKPEVIIDKCRGCGKCAESCPASVIILKDRKAQIDHNKCIKCFCCQEVCPYQAISAAGH